MATHAERRRATRERILAAADELFRDHGYEATRVEDVLAAADVARGTFYQHFEGKLEVLMALGRRQMASGQARMEAELAGGRPPLELLQLGIDAATHWFEANPALAAPLMRATLRQASLQPPEEGGSHRVLFGRCFAAAQDRGEVRGDASPTELGNVVAALLGMAVLDWAEDPTPGALIERGAGLLPLILDGVRRRPAPRRTGRRRS